MTLHDATLWTALALAVMSVTRLIAWTWLPVAAALAVVTVVFF